MRHRRLRRSTVSPSVAQEQPHGLAVLDHRAEVGASQPVAVEPELQPPETAVRLRVEGHDADVSVGQRGAVIEPFGIVILHVERHGPCHLARERAVECCHAVALRACAEELRIGEDVVGRPQTLESFVFGEVVHRQKIAARARSGQQARQFVRQRRAVGQQCQFVGEGALRTSGASHVVAEVLLDGHHREVPERRDAVVQKSGYFLGKSHRIGF